MTEKNEGGPAFPQNLPDDFVWRLPGNPGGMSLRDWFAGQALAALIAQCNMPNEVYARMAYTLADTMLQQRKLTD